MEKKIYEILGIKYYRKFVLFCKAKFNKFTKTQDNDNYFLKGYSKEDIIYLKKQFVNNLKIHIGGTAIGLFLLIIFLLENPISALKVGFALFVFLLNGYSSMLQRYNLLKINKTIMMYWFKRAPQNKGELEESAFKKHGFRKIKKANKKINVRIKESVYQFDYETNKVYEIPSENVKFAICVSDIKQVLFINKDYVIRDDTTSPYRTFYEGLMKEPFKLCYPFNEKVIIEVKKGERLEFTIVEI